MVAGSNPVAPTIWVRGYGNSRNPFVRGIPSRFLRSPEIIDAVRTATFLLALLVLPLAVGAEESASANEAADLVILRQIEALRVHDFGAAYALVSAELRRNFTRGEFEWMVRRAHPEVASSDFAFVVRTHDAGDYLYVTVKVRGRNGQNVEALYEMVREVGVWRVNALSTRRDDGLL